MGCTFEEPVALLSMGKGLLFFSSIHDKSREGEKGREPEHGRLLSSQPYAAVNLALQVGVETSMDSSFQQQSDAIRLRYVYVALEH